MIRVLVAEDSAAVRALLTSILESDPGIKVVGEATTGTDAVRQAERLKPDLITMDIHMPELDGLQATKAIMARTPTPIVIVSSVVQKHDAAMSFEATRVGALTAVPKPENPRAPTFSEDSAQLIEMVKAMSQVKVVRRWNRSGGALGARSTPPMSHTPVRGVPVHGVPVHGVPVHTETHSVVRDPSGESASAAGRTTESAPSADEPKQDMRAPKRTLKAHPRGRTTQVLAIAASTGGPAALQEILSGLGREFHAPVLVVQHMAKGFMAALSSWLASECALAVEVAQHGELLLPDTVYLAPDDWHLGVTSDHRIALTAEPPIGGFRPAGTHLFESVARVYGANVIGVILTGMGRDGVDGLKALHAAGGYVIAQDEASSVVYGMPQEAVRAGVTDVVVDVGEVARVIIEQSRSGTP
jgi:two-component system chemotaxis response regulator CheB